jgi:hypothetical protein
MAQCFSSGRIISWSRPRQTVFSARDFIPVTQLARALAAAQEYVTISGLTVVDDTRPKALAVVAKAGDRWTWLPRSAIRRHDDGAITMPRTMAQAKGLLPIETSAAASA